MYEMYFVIRLGAIFRLVRRITIVGVFLFLLAALFMSLVFFQVLPNGLHRIGLQLTESVLNLNPSFVIPPVAIRIPLWKSRLIETLPSILRRFSGSVRPMEYRARRTVAEESNAYWTQFSSSWS
uniref:Acriflavin resistance protein n=2 Tax=Caenorhabditis tropicalis TaxID=1561998 RepID=A0A1I7UGT7_9PELO